MLLGVYLGFILPAADIHRLTPLSGNGGFGILRGAGTFFFVFAGFQRVAIVASEVKEPERTLPVAILVGFLISAVYFVLVANGTAALLGPKGTAADQVPLFTAASRTVGQWGEWLIVAAALLATLTTLTAGIMGASRVAQAMGAYRELPQKFGQGHGEKKTPRFGILVFGLGTAAVTAIFNLRPLLDVANVFILFWYSVTNIAAIRLEKAKWFAPRALSWLALAGSITLALTQPWWAILLAGGIGMLSLVFRHFLHR